jgi:hypothetical protein
VSDKNTSGNYNGGGPNSTGGPMGGPGRPGKRIDAAQQDSGDYTGPGIPHNPMRGVSKQVNQRPRQSPSHGAGSSNPT